MEKDLLDKLGQHLVWRMGRAEDEDVLVVRVGLASATPRFRELPRLLNLPEAEMRKVRGNQSLGARLLNISRGSLIAKMKEYDIKDFRYLKRGD